MKKIFNNLIKLDRYFLDEPVFVKYGQDIATQNYYTLVVLTPLLAIICLVGTIIGCGITELVGKCRISFVINFFVATLIFAVALIHKDKLMASNKSIVWLYYIQSIFMLMLNVVNGVVLSSTITATTYFVFIILLPMLIIDSYIRCMLAVVISSSIFIAVSYKYNPAEIFQYNYLNSLSVGALALGLPFIFTRLRLKDLISKDLIKKDKDIDSLTGLISRKKLFKQIHNVDNDNKIYRSIAIFDMDYFRHYNNTYGYIQGDQCIENIGKIFGNIAREHNLVVARFGGAEFIALSENYSYAEMKSCALEIVQKVASLNIPASYSPYNIVTMSAGVADNELCVAKNIDMMISFAEKALYKTKSVGKNSVIGFVDNIGEIYTNNNQTLDCTKQNLIVVVEDKNKENFIELNKKYNITYINHNQTQQLDKIKANKNSAIIVDNNVDNNIDIINIVGVLRNNQLTSHMPIVLVGESLDNETELALIYKGVDDFIYNLYDWDIMDKAIQNLQDEFSYAYKRENAQKDTLTGLYNRKAFCHKAELIVEHNPSTKYMILVLDIDKFKLINDYYGAKYGDRILCFIANELSHYASINNGICSRICCDNFAVLLPRLENQNEKIFAKSLENNLKIFNSNTQIFINFGAYYVDYPNVEISTMCDRAFLAMEKNKGKYDFGISYYDDKMRKEIYETQYIVDCMRNALSNAEFYITYQPKVLLDNGTIIGAEVLSRWYNPTLGNIPPNKFIPIFQETNFIAEYDLYVCEKVIIQIKNWLDRGINVLPISINISSINIIGIDIVAQIKDLLVKYNVDSQYLRLEIKQNTYMQNPQKVIEIVKEFQKEGLRIILDSFDIGQNSLNMLYELPLDSLKIDVRIMRDYDKSDKARRLIEYFVQLSKSLDIPLCAVGIETESQLTALRNIDCNSGQGFYFMEPIKANSLEKLLIEGKITEHIV